MGGVVQAVSVRRCGEEHAVYDENGQLLSGSMMDYARCRSADQIADRLSLDFTETPSPTNPLGVKGVGEAWAR